MTFSGKKIFSVMFYIFICSNSDFTVMKIPFTELLYLASVFTIYFSALPEIYCIMKWNFQTALTFLLLDI